MTLRRFFPAFLVALLMAALFTGFLARRLARPAHAAAAATEQIVVSTKDMQVGDSLQAASITTHAWPTGTAPAGVFHRPQDLAGRVLLYPVAQGEPILDRLLARPGIGGALPAQIPDGMRAVSVHAEEATTVAGFITPESFVDVLQTSRNAGDDGVTATILQDVRVLAVGQDVLPGAPAGKVPNGGGQTITLLLSPPDTQKLTAAQSQGKIVFALRNQGDHGQVVVAAVQKSTKASGFAAPRGMAGPSFGGGAAAPAAPGMFSGAAHDKDSAPKDRDDFGVQTVRGSNKGSDDPLAGRKNL